MDAVLKSAEDVGAGTETVVLSEIDMNYCTGCGQCLVQGDCPKKDGITELIEKMKDADGIILGSPVYFLNVTAQMKTFIDRCLSFGHRPSFQGKVGASVVVYAGVGSVEDVADYLNMVLGGWGITPLGKVCAFAVRPGDIDSEIIEKAHQLGQRMVNVFDEGIQEELHPKPSEQMKTLVTENKDFFKADYEFWKNKGWIE